MAYQTQTVLDAMRQLAALRGGGQDDGYRFALAWLVGARMVQLSMLPEGGRPGSLTAQATWHEAHPVIGKLCIECIWGKNSPVLNDDPELSQAASIVSRLLDRAPDFYLSVPDALWYSPALRNADWPVLAPEVCDLVFSLLDAESGSKVWLPFDPLGQLASRALRLGLDFESVGPRVWVSDFHRLCLAAMGIFDETAIQSVDVRRGPDGKREYSADYLIAVPPLGARLPEQLGWYEWEGDDNLLAQSRVLTQRTGLPMHLRLDRSDTWAPAALWPRVRRKAVFVAAQSLLFARGQEQKLREAWIRGGYPIEAILSLPGRMFATTSVASAILVFSRGATGRRVRMADLAEFTVRPAMGGRPGRTLDLERTQEVLGLRNALQESRQFGDAPLGSAGRRKDAQEPRCVRNVTFEELSNGECNLQPSRYLRQPLKLSGERARLRDLVEVIRAPVPTLDPYCVEAQEVGIPELDGWRPISPSDPTLIKKGRLVSVRHRRLEASALRKGDIVMSIKGTVGRTGLIEKSSVSSANEEAAQKSWSLVTSGNCIALRCRSSVVTPEFLLLYFRSKEFELQLDALLVGAVIPHVTPDALCDAVQIPIPSPTEGAAMQENYQRLCDLEAQAEVANRRIAEIVDSLWGGGGCEFIQVNS
jgi:N-6 DNA Methylase